MQRILIVEDNQIAVMAMKTALEKGGFAVIAVNDGETGYDLLNRNDVDLILLDLGLPSIDGTAFLSLLRRFYDIPVIVVSARGDVIDKVVALNLGADDYVVKPVSEIELLARVRAVLRRTRIQASPSRWLRIDSIVVNLNRREAFHQHDRLNLTAREFDILRVFVTHPGVVFSKNDVMRMVWGDGAGLEEGVVSVHMSRLRSKIDFADVPTIIDTVWGAGYRFNGIAVPIDDFKPAAGDDV